MSSIWEAGTGWGLPGGGGGGGVSYPLLAPDGTAAAPSYAFADDSDLGIYRVSSDVLGVSGRLRVPEGTNLLPGLAGPDADTGIVFTSNNRIDLCAGGIERMSIGAGSVDVKGSIVSAARWNAFPLPSGGTPGTSRSGCVLTNRGATGTATLQMAAETGQTYRMFRVDSHAFRIEPPSGLAWLRSSGAEAADKYLEIASDYGMLEVYYDGTSAIVLNERGTINVEP